MHTRTHRRFGGAVSLHTQCGALLLCCAQMAARCRTRQNHEGEHTTRAAPRRRRHPRWSGRACWRACPRGIFSNFVHSPLPRAAHGACRWPSSLAELATKTLCHELVRKLLVATVAARGAKRTADRCAANHGDSTHCPCDPLPLPLPCRRTRAPG